MSDLFLGSPAGTDDHLSHEAVHRPRRRSQERIARKRRRRRRTSLIMGVAFVAVAVGGYFLMQTIWPMFGGSTTAATVHDYPGPGHGSVQVTVKSGDTGAAIAATLVDKGVVATKGAFTDAFRANPAAPSIQPGVYNLALEMKAQAAVAALLDSASRVAYKVTIPEGLRATQIYDRISAVTTIPVADLTAAAADTAGIGLPAEAGGNVEGWLFPATYNFEPGSTAKDTLKVMVAKTISVLDAAGVPAAQRETVLIKASIVEKESRLDADRPKVARVIENRLGRQMALQLDSTVSYAVGDFGITTTAEQRKSDSPYNTYVHAGLPPGPIASPGEASIKAALTPADGDWLYFVTVDPNTGDTRFASTLAEHNANVLIFQQWLKDHPTS